MDKELRALIKELDRFISNGYLVVDFGLDARVKDIFANWVKKKELTTYCPLEGDEFECYLVPKKDIEQFVGTTPLKIKRFGV